MDGCKAQLELLRHAATRAALYIHNITHYRVIRPVDPVSLQQELHDYAVWLILKNHGMWV